MEKKPYVVIEDNAWILGDPYKKGAEVTLTDRQARRFLQMGRIEPKAAPKAKPATRRVPAPAAEE